MIMQWLRVTQELLLRKCRKVTCDTELSSAAYSLIRILKNQRIFRKGPQGCLNWKMFLIKPVEQTT